MIKKKVVVSLIVGFIYITSIATTIKAAEVKVSKEEIVQNVQIAQNYNNNNLYSMGYVNSEEKNRYYLKEIEDVCDKEIISDISYYKVFYIYNFDNRLFQYWIQYFNNDNEPISFLIIDRVTGEMVEFGDGIHEELGRLINSVDELGLDNPCLYSSMDFNYYIAEKNITSDSKVYVEQIKESDDFNIADSINDCSSIINTNVGLIDNPDTYEKAYLTKTKVFVTGYNKFTYRNMSYWKENGVVTGLANHCAPTAATNLIRYYTEVAGKKLQYNGSWAKSFRKIREAVKHDNVDGTKSDNARSGIATYCKSLGYSSSLAMSTGKMTLKDQSPLPIFKNSIAGNRPLYTSVKGHNAYENHGVLTVGYVTYTYSGMTSNYLAIYDGWTTSGVRYINTSYGQTSIEGFNFKLK